jgi:sigma-B regulation protein RsbU (phosphoserine phosphatase)
VSSPAFTPLFRDFWKTAGALFREDPSTPLASRLASAAAQLSGASRCALFLKDKEAWICAAAVPGEEGPLKEVPDPSARRAAWARGTLWIPLESEGEVHGFLGLEGIEPEESELPESFGLLFGALLGSSRFSRMAKDADFELRTRLLELESLYDLGLSLAGQLNLPSLADEVLFRSISLTDARKGALTLFRENGEVLLERSLGGEIFPREALASWRLPEGEAVINNDAGGLPTSGVQLNCQKCLVIAISVPGRRLGVLAVADKESRDGRVLDFTATDARLLSLFANQVAAAIETARLHREAIEKERIERELELAAAIQREILPRSLPEVAGVELAAAGVPTRQVGGDYYDFFPLSRGRIGFLVADVSGKGVPAALLVSTVHAAVHLQIDQSETIVELISRIDRHLQRYAAARKFLTLFFGVLEPDSGVLRYVSAGHNPALLLSRSGRITQVDSTGVPIGILPHATWREETRQMEPGDLICVYTDGVTEAVNEGGEEFGLDRLRRILARFGGSGARQICERALSDVADFARGMPQYDDQTLVVVRRDA